jgi:hypothetical protein
MDDKFQVGKQPDPKLLGGQHDPLEMRTKSIRKDDTAEAWRVLIIFLALLGALAIGAGLLTYLAYHGLLFTESASPRFHD